MRADVLRRPAARALPVLLAACAARPAAPMEGDPSGVRTAAETSRPERPRLPSAQHPRILSASPAWSRAPSPLVEGDAPDRPPPAPEDPTERYLAGLDLGLIARRGGDARAARYDPARLGKPLAQIDVVYDYDFPSLERVEDGLRGVERRRALAEIWRRLTLRAESDHERFLGVLEWLQQASFHSEWLQPMYPDQTMVTDPLVLMELGEMRCGHVARLAVDLFEAGGMPGRLVQLGGHVIAEVWYGEDWHYVDADLFGHGEVVIGADGEVPSVAELSRDPNALDAMAAHAELLYGGLPVGTTPYVSYFYFSSEAYAPDTVVRYRKASSDPSDDRWYGWDEYRVEPDTERRLHPFQPFWEPGVPSWSQVLLERRPPPAGEEGGSCLAELRWDPAPDEDDDVVGYQVFVSARSRGWAYGVFVGSEDVRPLWAEPSGWSAEMYEALGRTPPDELGHYDVDDTGLALELPRGATWYVSVMPYDAHGLQVGRRLYRLSNELALRCR